MRAVFDVHEGRVGGAQGRPRNLGGVAIQDRIVAALSRPEAYPRAVSAVTVHETHVSWVFVTDDRAYKVKKDVAFPFLDYSTPDKRRYYCEEEVRLNRRIAPDVYLGVVPITADLRVDGEGEAVEWAVEMDRLPEERMLDVLLDEGRVERDDVERIADKLAAFHATAATGPGVDEHGLPETVRRVILSNLDDIKSHVPSPWRTHLIATAHRRLARLGPLLRRRVEEGRIRDGHGDLHAANVCLSDGGIVFYDCIEFEPDFRCCDVAGEVAFLAMDVERRGEWELARAFVDRYVERSGDTELRELLGLYKDHRACVRGLVEALRDPDSVASRDYFRLALTYSFAPTLFLIGGLPATGKSYAARHVARAFGAEWLRSDVVRKHLAGMEPTEHWTGGYLDGPYRPELTRQTYAALRDSALEHLRAGRHVVVDATCNDRADRDLFRAAARSAGVACLVIPVECPEAVVRERMEARARDQGEVSDADFSVYLQARDAGDPFLHPDLVHDGTASPGFLIDAILDKLVANAGSGDA